MVLFVSHALQRLPIKLDVHNKTWAALKQMYDEASAQADRVADLSLGS